MMDNNTLPAPILAKMRAGYYNDDDMEPSDDMPMADDGDESKGYLEACARLAASLVEKRNLAVIARASCGIEQIWRADELAVEGVDEIGMQSRMIDYVTDQAPLRAGRNAPQRSHVVINIIRPKCETAEGRFADIQLPTDDKNWGMKATPVPELSKMLSDERPVQLKGTNQPLAGPDGRPYTVGEIARSDIETAKSKMADMEREIDDQLNECSFNAECRKAIRNSVRLGTGILKGPIVVKDLKKTWRKVDSESGASVRVLEVKEDFRPSSKSVDPWDVYPDPECREDISRAAYIWERETILPRELRDLAGIEGYLSDQIEEVLMEEPTKLSVATPKENQLLIKYNTVAKGNAYEKWEYNGELNKDDLEALGCDCSSSPFRSVSANVVMVNDRPIKVQLNPLDTGELPYDFFQWTPRSGIPWGLGVARMLLWPQRVVIAAWRAMMDNARDSAGANLVVGNGIEPVDGKWEVAGKKLWWSTEEGLDIRQCFAQFQLTNNQKELQAIIELSLKFADIESTLPMLFTGEKGELPETLGATNVMVDSANVALRSRVKLWDDAITRRHIKRYYDWNMQYSEKDEIKGDYKVDARGTSVLLERDQQGQSIEEIMGLRGDQELADMVDWHRVITQYFAARKLDVLLPDEKVEENRVKRSQQPPPADPAIEVVRMRSEGEMQKAQLVQQSDMAELQFKAEQAQLDREHQAQMKLMDRDIKAMELSASSGIALDKIKAELAVVSQKLRTQVSLATAKNVQPAEQVATPIAEPAGRAPEGEAFQK
jgi:hypothetical protein